MITTPSHGHIGSVAPSSQISSTCIWPSASFHRLRKSATSAFLPCQARRRPSTSSRTSSTCGMATACSPWMPGLAYDDGQPGDIGQVAAAPGSRIAAAGTRLSSVCYKDCSTRLSKGLSKYNRSCEADNLQGCGISLARKLLHVRGTNRRCRDDSGRLAGVARRYGRCGCDAIQPDLQTVSCLPSDKCAGRQCSTVSAVAIA